MPVPSQISNVAFTFNQNAVLLEKSFEGLTPEEWQTRPNESSNALLWVVGHIVWARGMTLGLLGTPWSREWFPLFARGARLVDPKEYPSPEEIVLAWKDVKASLNAALEQATTDSLSAAAPERIPSFDGKVGGVVSFFASHEALHVGQACYLRRWLGHEQVAG